MFGNALLVGNFDDVNDKKTENKTGETTTLEVDLSSKTVYINDSYNLDCIPFDTESIIDTDNVE
jgi:hypothetical protein